MRYRDAYFRDLPGEQQLFDYGAREDGQPVYSGHASVDSAVTDPDWVITFSKYTETGEVTEIYCLKGAWDDRVALFVDYA